MPGIADRAAHPQQIARPRAASRRRATRRRAPDRGQPERARRRPPASAPYRRRAAPRRTPPAPRRAPRANAASQARSPPRPQPGQHADRHRALGGEIGQVHRDELPRDIAGRIGWRGNARPRPACRGSAPVRPPPPPAPPHRRPARAPPDRSQSARSAAMKSASWLNSESSLQLGRRMARYVRTAFATASSRPLTNPFSRLA